MSADTALVFCSLYSVFCESNSNFVFIVVMCSFYVSKSLLSLSSFVEEGSDVA